jgi:hypothetical protein
MVGVDACERVAKTGKTVSIGQVRIRVVVVFV